MAVIGEGSVTCDTSQITAGDTCTIVWTFTVGATGLAANAAGTEGAGGLFRLHLMAGDFGDATFCGDVFGKFSSCVTIVVKDASNNVVSASNYSVIYNNGSTVTVVPKITFSSGYKVLVTFSGKAISYASLDTPDGKIYPTCLSRSDYDGYTPNIDNEERFEFVDAAVAGVPGITVLNRSTLAKIFTRIPIDVQWPTGDHQSETFDLKVVLLDSMANRLGNPAGTNTVTLAAFSSVGVPITFKVPDLDSGAAGTTHDYTFQAGIGTDAGRKVFSGVRIGNGTDTTAPASGYVWIMATATGVTSVACPCRLWANKPYGTMAADLHVHTLFEHQTNRLFPSTSMMYARDTACLDLLFATDHADMFNHNPAYPPWESFARQRDAARAMNTAGGIIIMAGFEWNPDDPPRHHNVLTYPPATGDFSSGYGKRELRTETKLKEKMDLDGYNYVFYPHPQEGDKDWSLDLVDTSKKPMGEIISYHGAYQNEFVPTDTDFVSQPWPRCYEVPGYNALLAGDNRPSNYFKHTLRYAWILGMKMVAYASSDTHGSHAGMLNWDGFGRSGSLSTNLYQRLGLAMIRATTADAFGAFSALQTKQVYATSGIPMEGTFQVRAAGGAWKGLGETISLAAGSYDFEVAFSVGTPYPLRYVEVYRFDPANLTSGDFADGYRTVKNYSYLSERHLAATLTKNEAALLGGVPVDGTTNKYFLFYLFAQCQEGTDTDLRTSSLEWLKSGATNEYYVRKTTDPRDPQLIFPPGGIEINGAVRPRGALGLLAPGAWGYGDNNSLGYSTIYVRLADNTDPDTKAAGYVKHLGHGGNGLWLGPVFVEVAA